MGVSLLHCSSAKGFMIHNVLHLGSQAELHPSFCYFVVVARVRVTSVIVLWLAPYCPLACMVKVSRLRPQVSHSTQYYSRYNQAPSLLVSMFQSRPRRQLHSQLVTRCSRIRTAPKPACSNASNSFPSTTPAFLLPCTPRTHTPGAQSSLIREQSSVTDLVVQGVGLVGRVGLV